MILKVITSVAAVLLWASTIFAQSPQGIWKTIDDNTSEPKSHIEIYEENGNLYGKVIKLLSSPEDKLCDQCPGDKKMQPILGLTVIEKLKPFQDYWKGGTILDPENGKEYKCSVWIAKDNKDILKVRGKHWTGLYRTQTWHRVR